PAARPALRAYRVARGDTLSAIARRFGVSVAALRAANGLRSDRIYPGQRLRIPARGGAAPALAVQPVVIPRLPVPRATEALPAPAVGDQIRAPQALRLRRGPKSYFATLTLVAPETPLTVVSVRDSWYEVQLPEGETGWVPEDQLRVIARGAPTDPATIRGADIARDAQRYLGVRYRWGGTSEAALDCSGFVYIVFSDRIPGLARLRSYDYYQMGAPVKPEELLPGDLVFFTTYAPGPSHVGIYVGEGRFIHASSGAGRVIISPLTDPYYASRYLGARRLLNP
ncbi:MAG TPA: NlpC/P60 family protein, partial [bacterium]|nr:NlpC/P60 family protein [bacterium]